MGTVKRCEVAAIATTDFTLTAPTTAPTFGVPTSFTARVGHPGATGTVQLYDDATMIASGTLANGTVSIPYTFTSAGPRTMRAVYSGDVLYTTANSTNVPVTVAKAPVTSVAVAVSKEPSVAGESILLTATVTPAAATGTVNFYDEGVSLGLAPVNFGVAQLLAPFNTPGDRRVTATYGGDPNYSALTSGVYTHKVDHRTPDPISGLTATQGTVAGAVNLSWATSTNAVQYVVYRDASASSTSPTSLATIAGTSYTDSSAVAGQRYYYFVRPINPTAQGALSAGVQGYANTPPSGATGTFSTYLGEAVTFAPSYTDPDPGDTFVLRVTTAPTNGTATVNGSQFTYTPRAGYAGNDTFVFSVTDRAGSVATGTISGVVNYRAPGAVSGLTATQGTVTAVVNLAWTASANTASYIVYRDPSSTATAPTQIGTSTSTSYSDTSAAAGVRYYYFLRPINPTTQGSLSAGVPGFANTPPSAASATFSAFVGEALNITPVFTDPDVGDAFSLAITTQPTGGTASVSGTQLVYTPTAGYTGADSFSFRVTDRAGASVTGTATGTVSYRAPGSVSGLTATQGTVNGASNLTWTASANAISYIVYRDASATAPAPAQIGTSTSTSYSDASATPGTRYYYFVRPVNPSSQGTLSSGVLGFANVPPTAASATFSAFLGESVSMTPTFTDPDVGDAFVFAVSQQPTNGTAVAATGQLTYTPRAGYTGSDSFRFTVTDRAGGVTTGTATGTVSYRTPSGVSTVTATQGTVTGSVNLSWSAPANALSYQVLRDTTGDSASPSPLGTVTTLSYSDTSAVAGTRYYYYVRSVNPSAQGPLSAAYPGWANTPPSAASAAFTTAINVPVTFAPTFTDGDAGDAFVLRVTSAPQRGGVTVSGSNFVYTPSNGYTGTDTFGFSVTDRAGAVVTGTATGTIAYRVPDPVSLLTASQGTVTGQVNLAWSASANSTAYRIYRDVSATPSSPTLIAGTITQLTYSDTSAVGGRQYYYFVQPYNPSLDGVRSAGVLGFANTAPVDASATFNTLQNQAATFAPTFTDNDPGDSFVLRVTQAPAHGTASVSGGQFVYTPTTGYSGTDLFQFSITDRGLAVVTGTANGTVVPSVPAAPLGIIASQGTVLGSVDLSWSETFGSNQYLIFRAETANAANPATIATVPAGQLTFQDRNASPGIQYFYRIKGVGASGQGPFSREVQGYADTPPTAATASATTIYETPVTFTPVVTDPDPSETFTLSVKTPPSNGDVVITLNRRSFTYTPHAGYAGRDTFIFTAADKAGATIDGSATVGVGCPAPTLSGLTTNDTNVFAGSSIMINGTYGNTGCPGDLTAALVVKSGTTVVQTLAPTTLAGAVSGPVAFNFSLLQPGSYTAEVKLSDAITGTSVTQSLPLTVLAFRMPTFTVSAQVLANLDVATVAVGAQPDCRLTDNRATAIADHAMCYYEVIGRPDSLVRDIGATLPTWSGKVPAAGVFRPTLSVYRYDDQGVANLMGTSEKTMTVEPLASMVFTSPPSVNVVQFMGQAVINVSQTEGTTCQITTNRQTAVTGIGRGTRMCLVEFDPAPPNSVIGPTGVTATFNQSGTATVKWNVVTFDAALTQIFVGTGSTTVNVTQPDISLELSASATNPIATVTRTTIGLAPTGGSQRCVLTVDPAKAQGTGADKPCLVEWTNIPPGLVQDRTSTAPSLVGLFTQTGVQPIGFDVVYFDASGARQVLLSATKPFNVDSPPMPSVVLRNAREISPGVLTAQVSGGTVANLVLDVVKWPMDAGVKWSDQAFEQTYRISPTRGAQALPVTAAPLWTKRQVTIRLFLRDAPDLAVTKTYDVISVPQDTLNFALDAVPATSADSAPLPVSARVDVRTRNGPSYDASTMGQWSVEFGFRGSDGLFQPQGDPVLTDATGVASSSVNVFGLTVARLAARATAVSPEPAYVRQILSAPKVTTVVKGTPIDATVLVKGLSAGPAPLIGIFRIQFATRADQLANESVEWKVSTDGGGSYANLDVSGLQVVSRMSEGAYLVKAILKNRNTKVTSETPPVTMTVWAVPKVVVRGNTFAFPGAQATLNANILRPDGTPAVGAITEWNVKLRNATAGADGQIPGPLATGNNTQIQFTAQTPGMYLLTVRSRMPSSNASDPRAWGTTLTQIAYGAPEKPSVRVTGPTRAEVGKAYQFDLSFRTRYPLENTSLKLGGEWTLPDGTVVPALTGTSYTPSDADLAAGKVMSIMYRGWVQGYEETTSASHTLTMPIWKYVWPEWKVVSSVTSQYAPTSVRLTALPTNLTLLQTLDAVTYTWTLPTGARILTAPTFKLDSVLDYGGDHGYRVTIADARGNSTTLEQGVSIADAKAYVLDMNVSNMSKWSHSPLTAGVTVKAQGGHPLDAIASWTYTLNGRQLSLPNKNSAQIPIEEAGDHVIAVMATSRMGATATKTATISVPNNQAPTCSVTAVPSSDRRFIAITAKCNDPDGAIVKYLWAVNGNPQQFSNGVKWTYIVQPGVSYPLTFDLSVIDDGGLTATASATAN